MRAALVAASCGSVLLGLSAASAQPPPAGPLLEVREMVVDSRSVRFTLRGPSGRVTASAECAPECTVGSAWWEGPGRYLLSVDADTDRDERELVLRGDEEAVRGIVYGADGRLNLYITLVETDPRVRVRIVDGGVVEVTNETDLDLEVTVQDGGVHWSWQPEDAALSAAERREASGSTRHFCGMGLSHHLVPARSVRRLLPLHSVFSRLASGPHVGSIALAVVVPGVRWPPVRRRLLARFSFDVSAAAGGTQRYAFRDP